MLKSDLILRIAAENPHLLERVIEEVVNTILGRISDGLVAGDRVELRRFGAFTVTERNPRTARNPRTGEAVNMGTRRLPQFRPGRVMQTCLNPSGERTLTLLPEADIPPPTQLGRADCN